MDVFCHSVSSHDNVYAVNTTATCYAMLLKLTSLLLKFQQDIEVV